MALPIGGIGTGTVSLGGRGDLRDWELGNRPAKGESPRHAFFALWTPETTRVLEGPIDPGDYAGWEGSEVNDAGLPRFASATFEAAYPLATVRLADPGIPLEVRLEAFNPLIPADPEASGLPLAVLRYVVRNPTDRAVEAAICGSLSGSATTRPSGLLFEGFGEPGDEGSVALSVDGGAVTSTTAWPDPGWRQETLAFWDDFAADGAVEPRREGMPVGSLACRFTVAPGAEHAVTYVLAWHFPHRRAWNEQEIVGNHYATRYRDAWDVIERERAALPALEAATADFVTTLATDLPPQVVDAALANLTALRSQTSFRTADGRFFGWEGIADDHGSCYGSCTHVWNYDQATPHLFGSLSRSMREVEFAHATDERGLMSFRVGLPLETRAREFRTAAADGQFGCLVKLCRDWKLSGDDAFLRELWPHARRSLEFAWIEGGWDADRDGVPEGCQHNTMDVEYYGPNPQMASWYLAALTACAEMAAHLGEDAFAAECADLAARGRAWVDAHLFTGSHYRHEIRPVGSPAPGLRWEDAGPAPAEPVFQLGDGCLIDQLAGQFAAHVAGLGHVLDPGHVRTALAHVAVANRRDPAVANPMRSYALGDEPALVMCSYAGGVRPENPFPYYAEVMTGFEYTAAVGMLQEGLVEEGLRVIADVRSRYDGYRRNPFDEAECGHHYARAMASWAAVTTLTGFGYDGRTGELAFAAADGPVSWFWSTGDAWGQVRQDGDGVSLRVRGGRIRVARLTLRGRGSAVLEETLEAGDERTLTVGVTAGLTLGGTGAGPA